MGACVRGKEGYGACTECAVRAQSPDRAEKKIYYLPLSGKDDPKRWWPRDDLGFHTVTMDFSSIDSALEEDEVGRTLRSSVKLQGTCVSVAATRGGEERLLGRARVYHVDEGVDPYFAVFGDIKVADVLRWRGMHLPLVSIRVALCNMAGFPSERVIWAPGRHADKLPEVGFREVELTEDMLRSQVLQTLADGSLSDNLNLISGLAHLDEAKLEEHVERARTIASRGYIELGSRCEERQPLIVHLSADLQSVLLSSSKNVLASPAIDTA